MRGEEYVEYVRGRVRKLKPLLERIFALLPEEEGRHYMALVKELEEGRYPRESWLLYDHIYGIVLNAAMEVLEKLEKGELAGGE